MSEIPDFDGKTYDRMEYHERLSTALGRIYSAMLDGQWRTIAVIAEMGKCSEAGASARLRDLRKKKFRAIFPNRAVESIRFDGGLWVYRVIV